MEIYTITCQDKSYQITGEAGTPLEVIWLREAAQFPEGAKITVSDEHGNKEIFCLENPKDGSLKPYYFCMDIWGKRTDMCIGKKTGVVFACNEDEAWDIAWDRYGSDVTCNLFVEEISEEGYQFTIYRSAM